MPLPLYTSGKKVFLKKQWKRYVLSKTDFTQQISIISKVGSDTRFSAVNSQFLLDLDLTCFMHWTKAIKINTISMSNKSFLTDIFQTCFVKTSSVSYCVIVGGVARGSSGPTRLLPVIVNFSHHDQSFRNFFVIFCPSSSGITL